VKPLFFVSDAHLGADKKPIEKIKERNLLSFLEMVKSQGEGLYILGDLFDFWFEYHHAVPNRHYKILFKLSELVNQGVRIDYIAGNHDYWFEDFFPQEIGVHVHKSPLEVQIHSKRFLIAHGDGIIKNDPGYLVLKRILQNPLSIRLYRLVHPDLGIPLARIASRLSRQHPSNPSSREDEDYLNYAKSKFKIGFDFVVLGHSHRPLIRRWGDKTFVNVGDWMRKFTYGRFDGENLTLEKWGEDLS